MQFYCNQSTIKGTLHVELVPFGLYLGFLWKHFPENSYLALPVQPLNTT